jgi:hypothetical protein
MSEKETRENPPCHPCSPCLPTTFDYTRFLPLLAFEH